MQTVQFKVLNTDTQETNVQMQTENKAQNTQNTEVSGVESTGTKKKTSVCYGCGKCQMGCRFAVKKMCL